MYPARLIEHFQNPRNVGELGPPAITVEVANPACGDTLRLGVRFAEGRAAEVRYKVRGCTASIAAGSALTEWIAGKTRGELAAFDAGMPGRPALLIGTSGMPLCVQPGAGAMPRPLTTSCSSRLKNSAGEGLGRFIAPVIPAWR